MIVDSSISPDVIPLLSECLVAAGSLSSFAGSSIFLKRVRGCRFDGFDMIDRVDQLLGFPKSAIEIAILQQFFVTPKPNEPSVIQHEEPVGFAQGG